MNNSSKKIWTLWGFVLFVCLVVALFVSLSSVDQDGGPSLQNEIGGMPEEEREPPSEWNTYHGGPTLDGVADTTVPDEMVVLWMYNAGGPVLNTPVSCAGRVFFVNDKGHVTAVDMDGQELWKRELTHGETNDGTPKPEVIDAPLACFDATVLAGSANGIVYAFDAATGETKWTHDIEGTILGTPNYRRGERAGDKTAVLVISQDDGVVNAISADDGSVLWKTEGVDRCDGSPAVGDNAIVFGSCASALHVFSPVDGSFSFDIAIDDDSQVAGGVALVDDTVFSGSRSGKLIHADTASGKMVWVNEDSQDEVFTTPAVSDDAVVFSSSDGNVFAIDRATGEQKWVFETEGSPTSPVIARDKVVFSVEGTLHVLRLDDGSTLWSYDISDETSSPAVFSNMIVVGADEGTVTAFGEAKRQEEVTS